MAGFATKVEKQEFFKIGKTGGEFVADVDGTV